MTHDPAGKPTGECTTSGVGALRHLASAALALALVPVGYACLDYAASRGYAQAMRLLDDSVIDTRVVAATLGAMVCFFLAAAAGRLSGLGPLLAGLLWGVVPTVWALVDLLSLTRRLVDLPDVYDQSGFGIIGAALVVFPTLAALLLGAAVAGRWRRVVTRA